MKLVLYYLYPELLNLYGDRGNIMTLAARCRWRGIELEIRNVSINEKVNFAGADLVFLGGGSDREQGLLAEDLRKRTAELKDAIKDGLVFLAICGGYQLLGEYFQMADGQKIPGLEILDLYTEAGTKRLIGNVIVEIDPELEKAIRENTIHWDEQDTSEGLNTLVGFENHSGKTYLGNGLKPLGKVLRGYGNNGEDLLEGVRYMNTFGTYLHGPLLPKNPQLADLLLGLALRRKGYESALSPLEDTLEKAAHKAVISRFSGK